MKNVKIEPFKIIGIAVTTSNTDGQSQKDIGELWGRMMSENLTEKIPNKLSSEIYSLYTNYQGDHTQPYDTILGCKVSSLDEMPEGFVGQSFDGGNYQKFLCKGDLTKGAVYTSWTNIWNEKLDRVFTADFEVYGSKAQNPQDAELDIYVSIN